MSSTDFVETVHIQNFGCVHDARLELTRLHALIGPNDSGKSTVLGALRMFAELIRVGEEPLRQHGRLDPRGGPETWAAMTWAETELDLYWASEQWTLAQTSPSAGTQSLRHGASGEFAPARGATLMRWDADTMRRPCALIPEDRALTLGEKGDGLPAIYEAILSRDRQAFDELEAGVRRHFPTVRAIWLPTSADSRKSLGVILNDGTKVHADLMSEGLLYWLAFAVLPHVDSTPMLLIEEPENSLHPSRIADVMKLLRAVSQRTQIILATHSPLVINELQPDEVTILTRDATSGTRATRMDRTTHFHQRQNVYALGELWLSFADGVDETALIPAGPAHAQPVDPAC